MHSKQILFVLLLLSNYAFSNEIDKSINVIEKTNQTLGKYQKQINHLDEKKEKLFQEYKYVNQEIKSTKNYNTQLQNVITSQEGELKNLEDQLVDIENTQKNIYPLMEKMVKSLKKLVELDTPFLLEERKNRIDRIEQSLNRADIKTAEKFRIILEAFKIEYDYAKNIETYQDISDDKTYNFLRLGRVALYKQSLDLKDYFVWDNKKKQWEIIEDSNTKANIRKGIKIAKKQENVSLLELPFKVEGEENE